MPSSSGRCVTCAMPARKAKPATSACSQPRTGGRATRMKAASTISPVRMSAITQMTKKGRLDRAMRTGAARRLRQGTCSASMARQISQTASATWPRMTGQSDRFQCSSRIK